MTDESNFVGRFRVSKNPQIVKTPCYARCFDLLRKATLSSIHIHFGVALLVFATPLTSAVCQKMLFTFSFFRKFRFRKNATPFSPKLIIRISRETNAVPSIKDWLSS